MRCCSSASAAGADDNPQHGPGSRSARLLLAQRITIGSLAVALALNAATPFIAPDLPWLSDVPVVFAIMMLLIIIGLLHRFQSEPREGWGGCLRDDDGFRRD